MNNYREEQERIDREHEEKIQRMKREHEEEMQRIAKIASDVDKWGAEAKQVLESNISYEEKHRKIEELLEKSRLFIERLNSNETITQVKVETKVDENEDEGKHHKEIMDQLRTEYNGCVPLGILIKRLKEG